MTLLALAAALAAGSWAASVQGPRPTAQAAAASLREIFNHGNAAPLAPAGPLLNYLSFENGVGPGDGVTAALRAEAAAFLKAPRAVTPEDRLVWTQKLAVLNRLRDHLEPDQAEAVQSRFSDVHRARRAELTALIEKATRDWSRAELGLEPEPEPVAAPESNVVSLRPRSKAPTPGFGPRGQLLAYAPERVELLRLGKQVRGLMGWPEFAVSERGMHAMHIPVGSGVEDRAVMIHFHGQAAAVLVLGETGVTIGFGIPPSVDGVRALRKAGLDPGYTDDPRVFQLRGTRESEWFRKWRAQAASGQVGG